MASQNRIKSKLPNEDKAPGIWPLGPVRLSVRSHAIRVPVTVIHSLPSLHPDDTLMYLCLKTLALTVPSFWNIPPLSLPMQGSYSFSTQLKSHLGLRKAVYVKQCFGSDFMSWDTQMIPCAWCGTGSASLPASGLKGQYLHSPTPIHDAHRPPAATLCPSPSNDLYSDLLLGTW